MFRLFILIGLGLILMYFRDRTISSQYSRTLMVRLTELKVDGNKTSGIAESLDEALPSPIPIPIPFIMSSRKIGEEIALQFNPKKPDRKLTPEHIEALQATDRLVLLSGVVSLSIGAIGISLSG